MKKLERRVESIASALDGKKEEKGSAMPSLQL